MAADTGATGLTTAADPEAAALAGLDNLELQQARGSAGDRARKIWGAVWPKLLAIAIVLGAWELIHLSGWKSRHPAGAGRRLLRPVGADASRPAVAGHRRPPCGGR